MSNHRLFKPIRLCVTLLCLVIGLCCLGHQPLSAQTPTLDVTVNGDNYPTIGVTARCRGLGARANELFLEVYEHDQRQSRSDVTVKAAAPKRILLLIDISVHGKAALPQIANALSDFNDLCTWGKDDQIAVYVPAKINEKYQLFPLVNWTTDRGAAANCLRQFADVIVNPQAFAKSDPMRCDLAIALPHGNTPLLALTKQAAATVLEHFTPSVTKGILVVFSDGVDHWQGADKFVAVGNEIRQSYDLFAVFLADAEMKQAENLLALVDAQVNRSHYFALGNGASLTLTDLWHQVENPQTYKFTYRTQHPPPVALLVEARADDGPPVRERNSLSVQLQPVQLAIIEPPLGTIFPVTRTAAISATTLTAKITAQVEISWPAGRAPTFARLYYRLNDQPPQMRPIYPSLVPRQVIPLTLTDLPGGSYQLLVTVDGGHPTLLSADKSFFEIREKDLAPIQRNEAAIGTVAQRISRQQDLLYMALFGATMAGVVLLFFVGSRLRRQRQQTEERDAQLEKQLARLQLEQKSLAGSLVPMTASDWKQEQPKLRAALFLLQGGGVPEFIPILADEEYSVTTLGSGDRNTVRLWHRYVDDQHCLIRYENNKCFIRDGWQEQEISTNGTFVNHEPVGWEERKLDDGDQIQLGLSVRYSFRSKRTDDLLLTDAPMPAVAPTPAMMLTLADPPVATPQTQAGQGS